MRFASAGLSQSSNTSRLERFDQDFENSPQRRLELAFLPAPHLWTNEFRLQFIRMPRQTVQTNGRPQQAWIQSEVPAQLLAPLISQCHNRKKTVNHSAEEWVVGDVHTNSIEGLWDLFKRSIAGSFHKVSSKHLDRYVEELEWRFGNRDNDHMFVDTLRRIVSTDNLTYRDLVAAGKSPRKKST